MILTLYTSEFSSPPCRQQTFSSSITSLKELMLAWLSRTLESRFSHPSPFRLLISKGRPVISWKSSGSVNSSTNAQLPISLANAFSTKKYQLVTAVQLRRWLVGMRSSITTSSRFPLMCRQQTAKPTLLIQTGFMFSRQPRKFYSITCRISITRLLLFPEPKLRKISATDSFISEMRAQSFSASPPPQMMEEAEAGKILSSNFYLLTKRWLTNSAQCEGMALSSSRNQLFLRTEALDLFRSSNSLCVKWGNCEPIFKKQVSDRVRMRVSMPIFWHYISQLSSITCPISLVY